MREHDKPQLWKVNDRKAQKNGNCKAIYWVKEEVRESNIKTQGQPKKVWKTGDIYKGEWQNNKKHGYGIQIWANGNKYEGDWKNGRRDGHGVYWIKTKATKKLRKVYSGNWKKGQKSGLGVYYYPDKGRYEGNWENGMRQGQGTLFFANSDVYVGDWNEDRQSGFGTLTKENEDVYEGEWLNGKREGPGIYYYKSKQKIYDGEWVNDIPKCGIYTAASAFFDDTPDDASHPSDSDIDGRSAIDSRKKALKRMRKRLDPLPRLRLANPDEVLAVEIENIQRERQAVRNLPFMELEKLFSEQGLDDLRRIFSHYDANAAGCVDVLKLKEVMLELGFSISDPELAQLLVDLGKKAGEKVNFSEFVKAAHLIDNWKAKQEQDAEALARASMDTERNGGDEHEYYDYNAAMGTGL